MFFKTRVGDENIGKLIVFSVTIVVALGVLATFSYFYTTYKKNENYQGLLFNTKTSKTQFVDSKICNSNTSKAYVSYDPMSDSFGLTCIDSNGNPTINSNLILSVAGLRKVNCSSYLNSHNANICYIFNK